MRAVSTGAMTTGSSKPAKDWLWKLGGGPFPIEMYQLFLDNKEEKNITFLSDEHLEKLRKYSNNKRLSEKVLIERRERIFRHKSKDSIIVNEIKGIYSFLRDCKDYVKMTIEMYVELNGKQK